MVLMFVNFLVERTEHAILGQVDTKTEVELGHRFVRTDADHSADRCRGSKRVRSICSTPRRIGPPAVGTVAQSLEKIASAGRESAKDQHKLLIASWNQRSARRSRKTPNESRRWKRKMLARQEKLLTTIAGPRGERHRGEPKRAHQGLIAVDGEDCPTDGRARADSTIAAAN